jgi:hypothetical protein
VPMQLNQGDRRILLIIGVIFVLMVAVAVFLSRGGNRNENVATVYSAASGGSKAAFLLLRESGYQASTWEQPLNELRVARGHTLVLADPAMYPSKEERQQLEKFLRSGGHIVAAGRFAGFYLPQDESAVETPPKSDWQKFPAIGLSPITKAAPEITLTPAAYWRAGKGGIALYGEPEKPVVIEYQIGEGHVLWLASATPLTNAGLKEAGNLEFFLAAVGRREETQVLWDEYVHGYRRSAPYRASNRIVGWVFLQLAFCAVAVLLAYSRRSSAIWIPAAEVRLSPLEFVRTLGALYDHAHAGSTAVEIYYQRFRYLLTRRLGLPVSSSVEELERAVRRRWPLRDAEFAGVLRDCESSRYEPALPPKTALRLVQALFECAEEMQLSARSRQESKAWKR